MESKYFIYDGIKSNDLGIFLINIDGGMSETPFFGGRNLDYLQVTNKIEQISKSESFNPIEITVMLSPLDNKWTPDFKFKIGKWLFTKEYKELQFGDDLGKFYYAKVVEAPNFYTYGGKGYVEVTFSTNSPFAWTTNYFNEFDLSSNTGKTTIIMENKSNVSLDFFPKIEIQNRSGKTFVTNSKGEKEYQSKVSIKNLSFEGEETVIAGFDSLYETISIDNENQLILSDLAQSQPYTRFNKKWLRLKPGQNFIEIEGKCKIWTKMRFPILQ